MIKKIWDKVMNREVISYLVFGVLTTVVNWIVYVGMVKAESTIGSVLQQPGWFLCCLHLVLIKSLYFKAMICIWDL